PSRRRTLPLSYPLSSFFFHCSRPHLHLHSFPTRRSSDLSGNSGASRSRTARSTSAARADVLIAERVKQVARAQSEVPLCALATRSEEHTSELQSRRDLVCRLLLEKKKKKRINVIKNNTNV